MSISHEKLLVLFPNYKAGDWELMDAGDGIVTISAWNRPEPIPTRHQLDAVNEVGAKDAYKTAITTNRIAKDPTLQLIIKLVADLTNTPEAQVRTKAIAIYQKL